MREQIINLWEQGYTPMEISSMTTYGLMSVSSTINIYYKNGCQLSSDSNTEEIKAILSDYYIGGRVNADEALREIHDVLKNE